MKLGLSFPQTEIGTDPIVIKDFLQAAEELGYDFVTFVDHVLGEEAPRGPLLRINTPVITCFMKSWYSWGTRQPLPKKLG